MIYPSSLRKIIMLAFTVATFSCFIVRAIQRYCSGKEQFFSLSYKADAISNHDLDQQQILELSFLNPASAESTDTLSYNFDSMLKLIELSKYVKNEITGGFGFAARKRKIDQIEIKALLEELLRERAKLRDYLWDLKGCSKVSIPHRQHRALTYYLEIIDTLTAEMRELIK